MVTTRDEVCVTTYYLEFPPLMTGEQRLSFFFVKGRQLGLETFADVGC
jgi:hypothetical protein